MPMLSRAAPILLGATLLLVLSSPHGRAGESASGWDAVPAILKRIVAPTFPDRVVDITKHGAVAGGASDCRPAIQAAIAACAKAGGGRVLVPTGRFLCNGPIHLVSGIDLHLEQGSTILFGTNPDDYLVGDPAKGGGVLMGWEGTRIYSYSPLVYAFQQKNIAITGKGTLDGQTGQGWSAWKKQQGGAQGRSRQMNHERVPVEQRIFGKGSFLRPTLIEPYECANVLIEGITVRSSPFWTIHPNRCTNVIVRGVSVQAGTTNDDGLDPDSCTDVLIEDCNFTTNDDNIALKAGRDHDGWAANGGRPCSNIIIRRCTFLRGAPGGISLGSEMSGDIRNVFVEDCTMKNAQRPFFMKSNPDRGGVLAGFWARNVTVERCDYLFKCEMNYKNVTRGGYPPRFTDFHLDKVTCANAKAAFDFRGLPGNLIDGITLTDVSVGSAGTPLKTDHIQGLRLVRVTVNGQALAAP